MSHTRASFMNLRVVAMAAAALLFAESAASSQPVRSGNPILAGWYADPEGHVFDGRYWIFPTWSAPYGEQTFLDAFSSRDLITWEKHARVLDTVNVSWARRALWAPSIVEKGGWYYLFFGANDIQNDQQLGGIGVARSRSPAGPFRDILGKPLIGAFHNGAQPIDQMVFQDLDGAWYIAYGGWRHCNIARLNDDFTGFVPFPDGSTFKEITPAGYVEGAYMLVKDGKYYFMWSEGGWTGPNYAVAYAVGASPFGPFERVGRILQQDSTVATGAGHHSVLHAAGSPNWYIVYHRRPLGETDRNHRVVSIDELRFDAQGFIQPVTITRAGVAADSLPPAATLKDAYGGAFLMGSAVNEAIVAGADSVSRDIVLRQFNSVTAENVLKAEHVNPQRGVFTFGPADAFVEFGAKHGMFIVGHTLVWHNQTPAWFFQDETGKPNTKDAQLERLRSHIEAVAGRYVGKIHAWDVVNEVIDNDGSYRPTTWVRGIGDGDSLVKSAFRFAARYAPGAELYYNDFNAWRPAKRDGIVRLVRMLQKEGIRIDGVGMQGHWGLNYPSREYIEAAIDSFAALGVKVMITELDVDVLPLTREGQIIGTVMSDPQFQLEEFKTFLDPYRNGLPADVQQQLALRYAELFGIFYRKRDKIDRVTLWGVHDGMSWKNGYPVPGRTNYPLLYSRELKPKPAFDAVLAVPHKPQ